MAQEVNLKFTVEAEPLDEEPQIIVTFFDEGAVWDIAAYGFDPERYDEVFAYFAGTLGEAWAAYTADKQMPDDADDH